MIYIIKHFLTKVSNRILYWLKKLGIMSKERYTIKKRKNTEEYHIFRSRQDNQGCYANQKSICQKMDKLEGQGNNTLTCGDEDETRKVSFELKRNICGICVSDLYLTTK